MLRERNWMSKFEKYNRIQKRRVTTWIFLYISLLSVFHRRNENQNADKKKMYEKIQIVTWSIQFFSCNIKVFNL